MRVKIENWMRYSYEKPVSFSPHIIRLYPRADQGVVTHVLKTSFNLESDIQYRRDLFDNLVANCYIPKSGESLEIHVELEVELWPKNPFHFLLARYATELPFEYTEEENRILSPFRIVLPDEDADTDSIWQLDRKRSTVDALVDLASTLHSEIAYETREDGAARPPSQTLDLRSGACRDTALLGATVLRKAGLAVRLVSGYLCEFHVDVKDRRAQSALHAWIEVYLPGAGWVGIDPTNGTFCDHRFITTAVGALMQDVAPVQGVYYGSQAGTFDSHLDLTLLTEKELPKIALHVEKTLADEKVQLTMGGEPTFVPKDAEGPEWNFVAIGPNKIRYAYAFADRLIDSVWPDGMVLYTPGKHYPGEVNPRLAITVLRPPTPLLPTRQITEKKSVPDSKALKTIRDQLARTLSIDDRWQRATDPLEPSKQVWVLPIDFIDGKWIAEKWGVKKLDLIPTEGPAGLRLPLNLLPSTCTKRALVLEVGTEQLSVFLPPLMVEPWQKLIQTLAELFEDGYAINWQGYVPTDLPTTWTRFAFTLDPGVLEVNIPACKTWQEYQDWISTLEKLAEPLELRSYKGEIQTTGTGGGCHLLFGGPSVDSNPFFTRPVWIASILRFWQHHPSLAYLFTGSYVGPSSQAPRPDESGNAFFDLELAYQALEGLPEGDHRMEIHEFLRHLHTDVAGNTHRSESSFDKFWNPPTGCFGLIEFRAIESLPKSEWTGAVTLLWRALLGYLLKQPFREPLKEYGTELHDKYFLPTALWSDLTDVLSELAEFGFGFDPAVFRSIWEWRFPVLLELDGLTIRKALEGWPLLAETPTEGGNTSRFVDTSIERIEFVTSTDFNHTNQIFVNNRELGLRKFSPKEMVAGLRYRKSHLYPSLHPQIPIQLPLKVTVVNRDDGEPVKQFILHLDTAQFVEENVEPLEPAKPCETPVPGMYTADLRIQKP
jgi:uncharacterized protein (DUF2126 family)/transglutaminase-like putative cysteine protease